MPKPVFKSLPLSGQKLKLLITRPEKQAAKLAKQCELINVDSLSQPLFSYQINTHTKADDFNNIKADSLVIFISVAAVEFANQIKPLSLSEKTQTIAVGKATQRALLKLGIDAITPKTHTSEGVLALPLLQNVSNKNIVIVRGDGGRELMFDTLMKRGAKVDYIEVYQRLSTKLDEDIANYWQQEKITAVLLTSNGILECIDNSVDLCDNYWKNTCLWITASQRIADMAIGLGLKHVVNAGGANDEAIMAVVKEYGTHYDQ